MLQVPTLHDQSRACNQLDKTQDLFVLASDDIEITFRSRDASYAGRKTSTIPRIKADHWTLRHRMTMIVCVGHM